MAGIKKSPEKYNYEILFKDSPEYFYVDNARMLQEDLMIRFLVFENDNYLHDLFFPINNIYRVKRVKT